MRKICSGVILNFSRVLRPRKINREKVLLIRGRRPRICKVFENRDVNRRKAMKNGIIFFIFPHEKIGNVCKTFSRLTFLGLSTLEKFKIILEQIFLTVAQNNYGNKIPNLVRSVFNNIDASN